MKKVVIFVPGYTLLASVFENYQWSLHADSVIYFDYINYSSFKEIKNAIRGLIKSYASFEVTVVCQSIGFKILIASINTTIKVHHIIAFNPYWQIPQKLPINEKNHLRVISLSRQLSKVLIKCQLLSISTLLFIRHILGNSYYDSIRFLRCLSELRNNQKKFDLAIYNPLIVLLEPNLKEEENFNRLTLFIGREDKLLNKGFSGGYYNELYKIFPQAKLHWLPGGHEGFLENEKEWIKQLQKII